MQYKLVLLQGTAMQYKRKVIAHFAALQKIARNLHRHFRERTWNNLIMPLIINKTGENLEHIKTVCVAVRDRWRKSILEFVQDD